MKLTKRDEREWITVKLKRITIARLKGIMGAKQLKNYEEAVAYLISQDKTDYNEAFSKIKFKPKENGN